MQPEDLIGQTLGHYKIKRQIGYGGMSAVFLAEDIHLGREIALKVFWPRQGETQDFLRRFTREARVLAQLDHPHILPVYDYGEQDDLAFLVSPYMSGGSLKELLLKRKVLPPSEAIQLISQVLPALQYAHERNLIHRDIKPGNLLFKADGSLVLADFGLVKVLEDEKHEGISLLTISESGEQIAGTPEYMPPEQINGHAVPASDIYALGVVLYEMVTGVRPFTGNNLLSVLLKHANEAARPPRELNPYISKQLEAVILQALEKDPARRFASPAVFLQALQQLSKPNSHPGLATLSPAGALTQPMSDEYRPAVAAGGRSEGEGDAPLPVPQSPRSSSRPLTPADTPTLASKSHRAGFTHPLTPPAVGSPSPSQPGLSSGDNPVGPPTPLPSNQAGQPWTLAQTVAPPPPHFVPRHPGRSRTPLVALLILLVLIAGVVFTLFLTPLGTTLFGPRPISTPTATLGPGNDTPTGRGVHTPTSGATSTQPVGPTSTTCPADGSARAAVTARLVAGHDPTIVYLVNETDASGNPTYGTVKIFDTVNGQKTELAKTAQTSITEAQVSSDGQWVLFTATVAGQSELRMVRLDGQGLQTLFCAPGGATIRYAQWSIDQRYVIFDEFPSNGAPTVYLLNTQTGALQVEITPSGSGPALAARTWLDNDRVLMTGIVPYSDAPPQNIYVLNLANGANQNPSGITKVFTSTKPCWDFDSSYDGRTLFLTECVPGTPDGSSTISQLPAAGGTPTTLLSSSTLAFSTIRVVDPASSTLLALASNAFPGPGASQQHDGLYLVKTDGSGSPRLLVSTPTNTFSSLNAFSQYFWSNISRDGTMYALLTVKPQGSGAQYILSYGQLNGGTSNAITDYNQQIALAGWTTT